MPVPDVTNSECAGGFGFPLFSIILWSWKACFNLFGVVIAAKTWSCEDGLGEVGYAELWHQIMAKLCRVRGSCVHA